MESNNEKMASALLAEVYRDYQKDKRRRNFFKWAYFLFVLFIVFMALNTLGKSTIFDDLSDTKKVPQTEQFIPIIEIKDVIGVGDLKYETINHLLEEAFSVEKAPGIILHIESPGGFPYDCYEVTRKIAKLKTQYPEKKVIAQVGSLAASGGYYIASAADKIYASEASTIGSIGVIMTYLQYNRFLEKHDVIPQVHQAGKDKVAVHPLKELTEDALSDLQDNLNQHHQIFIDTVKIGRGDALNQTSEPLFTGKVWLGNKALELGLIDKIGLFDEMLIEEFGEDIEAHVIEEDFGLDFKKLLNQKPHIKIEGPDLNARTLLKWNGS